MIAKNDELIKFRNLLNDIKSCEIYHVKGLIENLSDEEILNLIFKVVRKNSDTTNYELSSKGHYILTEINLKFAEIEINPQDFKKIKGKQLIKFNQIMTTPWIIKANKIYIFIDSTIAFNMSIVYGDFDKFIELYED